MDHLKASAPDLELRVMTPEEVMKTSASHATTQQSPEAAEAARKEAVREEALNNPWGSNSGYPAPPGVIVPPNGTHVPPQMAKTAVTVTAWILVIGTDGAVAPVLRPVLAGF